MGKSVRKGFFSGEITTMYHEKWDLYEVMETIWFNRPNGDAIPIPKGMLTDFASVPRAFWMIVPKAGPHNKAAALHDYLCQAEIFPIHINNVIFKEALESIKEVPRWKIWPMFASVEVGTWATYGKHTANSIRAARRLFKISYTGDSPLWKDGVARFV